MANNTTWLEHDGEHITINFYQQDGDPGLDSFEQWKVVVKNHNATYQDYQNAFRGYSVTNMEHIGLSENGLINTYRFNFENGYYNDISVWNGYTPYIQDDYWWINGSNTGIIAKAYTPYIQDNYWWINGVNTGLVAKALTPEFRLVGNNLVYNYQGFSTQYPLFSLIEIGSGKVTYAERMTLSTQEGTKVFQTNGAKGEYQYINGAWYFIGNKTIKQITTQTYTLTNADIGYQLEFTLDVPGLEVEVIVPDGVFANAHIIDIIQGGAVKLSL